MSLRTLDATTGELLPAPRNLNSELFVDFDRRDDDQIMKELMGAAVEEYVYSFPQDGKTVMGLSLTGVMAVAQNMGGITCGQPVWTVDDAEITCDISATDHKNGLTVWGTATQLRVMKTRNGDKADTFARGKALSKAQRNAIRKLIPEQIAVEMLRMFINGGKPQRGNAPRQQPQQQRQVRQPEPPRQIEEATVDTSGRVVTSDGEIVGQLQRHGDEPDPVLFGEFERRLANADDLEELKAVGEWAARVDLTQPSVVTAFKARRKELRATAQTGDVEQPELIEV